MKNIYSTQSDAHLAKGNSAFLEKNWQEASEHYQLAIDFFPEHIQAHYNLGLVFKHQNELEKALKQFELTLKINADLPASHFQIGCIELQQHHFSKAKYEFQWVTDRYPDHVESVINLGITHLHLNHLQEAERVFHQAERLSDQDPQVLFNLAVIKNKLKQLDAAIFYYQRLLAIEPQHAESHYNLALIYKQQNKLASAQKHIAHAATLMPNRTDVQFLKSVYAHEQPDHVPDQFIQHLFDEYSERYDQHLLHELNYQLPAVFFDLYKACATISDPSILDLGAGTGLCGELFFAVSHDLTAVDLSEKMLAIAREKKVYKTLNHTSVAEFLHKNQQLYDVVLAADTLTYLGKLDFYFEKIHASMNKSSLFLFNIECAHLRSEPFLVTDTGRFSHRRDYIEHLSERLKFHILHQQNIEIRKQNGVAVEGWMFVLQLKNT